MFRNDSPFLCPHFFSSLLRALSESIRKNGAIPVLIPAFFSSLRHGRFQNPSAMAPWRQVNALMSDHLGASRDLTVDTVQRIEQSMKRALVVWDAKFMGELIAGDWNMTGLLYSISIHFMIMG